MFVSLHKLLLHEKEIFNYYIEYNHNHIHLLIRDRDLSWTISFDHF